MATLSIGTGNTGSSIGLTPAPLPTPATRPNVSFSTAAQNPEGFTPTQNTAPGASQLSTGSGPNIEVPDSFKITPDPEPSTPQQVGSATKSPGGAGGSGGSGGGKRTAECPYCKGEVLSEQNGRASSSWSLFPRLQNLLYAIIDLLKTILGGSKTVSRRDAIGGECKTCGNSGQIEDVTDTSAQDAAAEAYLRSVAPRILQLEKEKLGNSPGGSSLERIAGAKITIVGRTLNNAQSYTVHPGKGMYPQGAVAKEKGKGGVTIGPEKDKGRNVVTGNNVPANTGGGLYYIQAGNRFKVVAGSQGIDLTTSGPINLDGGMVRFSGAEVTIGGKVGPTVVEGDHLQLNGKSIAMTPSGETGQVHVQGSFSATGNMQSGGAYFDNLYFATATCPSKQEPTKISSQTDLQTGPAIWGVTGKLGKVALLNFLKWISDTTLDITLSKTVGPLSPRSLLKTADNFISLSYSFLPLENKITGICLNLAGPGIIINFPHEHAMPDTPHSHDMTVPAINHSDNTSTDVVRKKFDAAGGNSRLPATSEGGGGNFINKVLSGIGAVVQSTFAIVRPYNDSI